MGKLMNEFFLIKVEEGGVPLWFSRGYSGPKLMGCFLTPDGFIFSFRPFGSACLLGRKDALEINRVLHSRGFKSVVYSYSEAMKEHRRYLDSQREDAFREAEEEALKGQGLTGEEWESLPDKYIGKCDKNCYGWRKMEKGGVVDFGVRGVYVCTVCGYAYPPLFMPGPKSGELIGKMHRIDEELHKRRASWWNQKSEDTLKGCANL